MFRRILNAFVAFAAATAACAAFAAVDVDQASQAELESVKGIGPRLSSKILDARKAQSFKDWGDFVERVQGVGPGNAAKLSSQGLTVAGQAYAGGAEPAAKTRVARADKTDKTDKAEKAPKGERRSRKGSEATPQ